MAIFTYQLEFEIKNKIVEQQQIIDSCESTIQNGYYSFLFLKFRLTNRNIVDLRDKILFAQKRKDYFNSLRRTPIGSYIDHSAYLEMCNSDEYLARTL